MTYVYDVAVTTQPRTFVIVCQDCHSVLQATTPGGLGLAISTHTTEHEGGDP